MLTAPDVATDREAVHSRLRKGRGNLKMQMVILAGGLASRMGPLTQDMPKSMLQVNGKPFLEHQIELLRQRGITDIVLCVGYLAEQIKDYFGDGDRFGVHITYSEEGEKLLGTGGALKKAEPLLEEDFLLMYGDSYLLLDYAGIMADFRKSDKQGMMVVYRNMDCYDCSNVVLEANLVKLYDKKRKPPDMAHIDAGLSALKKSTLSFFLENEVALLEDLYSHLVQRRELLAFETDQRFYEIGSISGLEELDELSRSGSIPT